MNRWGRTPEKSDDSRALGPANDIIETEMNKDLIQIDPAVMMGKPVIVGTRITVELILEKLAAGETIEQILEAHPRLTREGISAALAYAAKVIRRPLPEKAA